MSSNTQSYPKNNINKLKEKENLNLILVMKFEIVSLLLFLDHYVYK